MSADDTPPPPCCRALGTLFFLPPFSACVSDPPRPHRPPRAALRQTLCPTRHGSHELRPGALTRPRRLRPTSGETPKLPLCLRRAWNTVLVREMTARFLRMSFVRAEPALLDPSTPIFGWCGSEERKQKLVPVGSAIHTERLWAGLGALPVGILRAAVADF